MTSDGGKGSTQRPGTGYGVGYDLIWNKLVEPCKGCGATDGEQCVCLPTDDGPGDDGGEPK